nr:putative RNA-directed DNA polymerase, eukaryota, reverse transcriptase zinc-binding domain protein [Tanacetum cinerariifolium]
MGCQIHSSHPQILFKIPITKSPYSHIQTKFQSRTIIALSSSYNQEPSISISTKTQEPNPKQDVYSVKFKTLGDCKLGISRYPDFEYNAQGGEGSGIGKEMVGVDFNGETSVDFDVKTLYIPSLSSATTKFLGLPLPPFLKIEIVPEIFRGIINLESGKVDLKFKARFWFSVGSIYKAPPLMVETLLTSEKSEGTVRSGTGSRLDEQGRCKLVGVATVEQIDDFLMNSFLDLPNECLAILNATITFSKD